MITKNKFFKNFSVIVVTLAIIFLEFIKINYTYYTAILATPNSINKLYSELTYFFILLVIQFGLCIIIYLYFYNSSKSIRIAKKNKTKYIFFKLLIIIIIVILFIQFGIGALNSFTLLTSSNYAANISIFGAILFIGLYLLVGAFTLFIINFKILEN